MPDSPIRRTRAKPFATLDQARDAIRELKKAGPLKEPVNVRMRVPEKER